MDVHVSLIGRDNLGGEIHRQLRQAILDGRLRAGEALPASRELARRLGVSRTTVTRAYERLAGEGFISPRVGAGTFVNALPAHSATSLKHGARTGVLNPRQVWKEIPFSDDFAQSVTYDFRCGQPDAALFPRDAWNRLMRSALQSNVSTGAAYGHPSGFRPLREAIARHIGISRGVACSADDIVITSGTQQAIDLVARVLVSSGARVAVEDPGYRPVRFLLQSLGARVAGVRVDREGIIVDTIPRGTRLLYVTPSHQYPLGVSMSLSRRLELVAWAERSGAAIIEDDYDSEFRFGGRPIEPLHALDTSGQVVYVGSFSKTLLPALRLGFMVTPPSLRSAVHRAKYVTDWHSPILAQAALARFMDEGGFARHLRKVSAVYRERHEIISSALASDLGDHLEPIASSVGLHIAALARRASVARIHAVVQRAAQRGAALHPLSRFSMGKPLAGLFIAYGGIPTRLLSEGLSLLHGCFD
jgi:GntR family transcriptional regulator / MocR family aminotransferase